MVLLNIIPDDRLKAAAMVQEIFEEYLKMVKQNFDDKSPLKVVPKREGQTIKVDIVRSIKWFYDFSEKQGLTKEQTKNADEHVKRILSLLSILNKELSYLQGFDRYVFITFFLGLNFTIKFKLCDKVAEAFSYYLSKKLLMLAKPYLILSDQPLEHFKELDKLLEENFPEKFQIFKDIKMTSFTFALRWKLLLFCDEHDVNETMLIWDSIILKQDVFTIYLNNLCVEHFKQVKINEKSPVECVQKYKNWDTNEIVKNANISTERLMKAKTKSSNIYIVAFIVLFVAFLVSFYFKDKINMIK